MTSWYYHSTCRLQQQQQQQAACRCINQLRRRVLSSRSVTRASLSTRSSISCHQLVLRPMTKSLWRHWSLRAMMNLRQQLTGTSPDQHRAVQPSVSNPMKKPVKRGYATLTETWNVVEEEVQLTPRRDREEQLIVVRCWHERRPIFTVVISIALHSCARSVNCSSLSTSSTSASSETTSAITRQSSQYHRRH